MAIRAVWNGVTLAESDKTRIVEGNHYFPPETLNQEYFRKSPKHTMCPWKGEASYYDIVVNGQTNPAGAWYYPATKPAAKQIENYIAFWQGVKVENVG